VLNFISLQISKQSFRFIAFSSTPSSPSNPPWYSVYFPLRNQVLTSSSVHFPKGFLSSSSGLSFSPLPPHFLVFLFFYLIHLRRKFRRILPRSGVAPKSMGKMDPGLEVLVKGVYTARILFQRPQKTEKMRSGSVEVTTELPKTVVRFVRFWRRLEGTGSPKSTCLPT